MIYRVELEEQATLRRTVYVEAPDILVAVNKAALGEFKLVTAERSSVTRRDQVFVPELTDLPEPLLVDLLVQWGQAEAVVDDLRAQVEKLLPPEGGERVAALEALLSEHGRATPAGMAVDLYLVTQRMIARRLRAREGK